jgi:hypothetical protein
MSVSAAPTDDLKVWLDPEGILNVDFGNLTVLTLALLREIEVRQKAITLEPLAVLMQGARIWHVEHEAQLYASSPEVCTSTRALALMVSGFLQQNIVKLFLDYHKPPYPARAFRDETEARAWLRAFR